MTAKVQPAWIDAFGDSLWLCSKCLGMKPADQFSSDKRKSNGLSSWCKVCKSAGTTQARMRDRAPWK